MSWLLVGWLLVSIGVGSFAGSVSALRNTAAVMEAVGIGCMVAGVGILLSRVWVWL